MLIVFVKKMYNEAIRDVYYLKICEKTLKGHSKLTHMRVRYHFVADLHVTRGA